MGLKALLFGISTGAAVHFAEILADLRPYLVAALSGLFAWAIVQVKHKYEQSVNDRLINEIVRNVVNFVEQTKNGEKGACKLDRATRIATELANEKEVKVGEVELKVRIESHVREIKGKKFES